MSRKKKKKPHLKKIRREALQRHKYTKKQWAKMCQRDKNPLKALEALDAMTEEQRDQLRHHHEIQKIRERAEHD